MKKIVVVLVFIFSAFTFSTVSAQSLPAPTPTPKISRTLPKPTPAPVYEPILGGVEPLDCEYDEFDNSESCLVVAKDAISHLLFTGTNGPVVTAHVTREKGGEPQLAWAFVYIGAAGDWIFLDKVIILAGGNRYSWDIPYSSVNREILDSGGGVYEVTMPPASKGDIDTMINLVVASDARIRMSGRSGSVDGVLGEEEKTIILRALATYESMGGQLPGNRSMLLKVIPKKADSASSSTAMTVTVTVDIANLRNGPGTNFSIVGQAPRGTVLQILETSPDGDWRRVGDDKWVSASLITP